MVGLDKIAIRIFDNARHTVTDITCICQKDKTLIILHKAIELRCDCIMAYTKTLDVDISKGFGFTHFKNMLLRRIHLAKIFTIFHSLPGLFIGIKIHTILASQNAYSMDMI
ncbi:Uncharacterised protein [Streptococcus pneumoniae]|nr:Uncharacterised protein [Streptococcus pneumoniae]